MANIVGKNVHCFRLYKVNTKFTQINFLTKF